MKYDIKVKWLEALTSGEYKQNGGCLFSNDLDHNLDQPKRMCCLGVLTDLYIKSHPDTYWIKEDIDGAERNIPFFYFSTLDGASTTDDEKHQAYYLHPLVSRWSGVEERGSLNLEGFTSDLSTMNDASHADGVRDYSYIIPIISEFL
tara:strand:- start:691 stop:1131 length:441 start_codon:yes stop_codon:yes gene_type:complete